MQHPIFGAYVQDTSFFALTRVTLFGIIFLNSQFFFVKGANPFGIYFVQELYLLFIFLYSIFYIIRNKGILSYIDFFVLFYVALFVLLSSIFAYFTYGQPLLFGVFESRVTFMTLVYFPLKDLIRGNTHRMIYAMDRIVYICLFFVFLGALTKLGIVSVTQYYAFGTSDVTARGVNFEEFLRGDRMATGRFYFIFITIYATLMFVLTMKRFWGILLLLFIWYVFFVLQERQSMVGIMIAVGVLMGAELSFKRMRRGMVIMLGGVVALAALIVLQGGIFGSLSALVADTVAADITNLARFQTALTIFENMKWLTGHGVLSPLWNGGFHDIYSPLFFLGDVGLLGTIFRLGGIPGITILLIAVAFFVWLVRRTPAPMVRRLMWMLVSYLVVTALTSAPFEYRGHYLALMLIIIEMYRMRQPVAVKVPVSGWNRSGIGPYGA